MGDLFLTTKALVLFPEVCVEADSFWAKHLVYDAEQLLPLLASWNYMSLILVRILHSCSR